jgi:ATP-dependent Clp protease adapter protein ClpS
MAYRLVVHDDATHTFDYVIAVFVRVLGVSVEEAFSFALRIHGDGKTAFNFYELATAREAEERLLSAGRDARLSDSLSSLTVSVEETTPTGTRLVSRGRVGPGGYQRLDEREVGLLHKESLERHGATVPGMGWRTMHHCSRGLASEVRKLLTIVIVLGLLALFLRALGP